MSIELILGDCLEKMKDIESGSIDAIITDPPYQITACKWDIMIPFKPMWEQLKRIIKPNGAIVLFGSEPFSSALRMSNIKQYKYDVVWEKTLFSNPLMAKKRILKIHENISLFYKKQCTYNPQMKQGKPYKDKVRAGGLQIQGCEGRQKLAIDNKGERYPTSVVKFSNGNNKNVHPTQKPVALLEYLIKTYTNENETVLDFTFGSGSTAIACINTNRSFIGIEKDKTYFNIATKRINEANTPLDITPK